MTSICIMSALLCLSLCTQAIQGGSLSKLVRVERIDHGNSFELIAEFETNPNDDGTVSAIWTAFGDSQPLRGSTLVPGRTTVMVPKVDGYVKLDLGGDWHYLKVEWNVRGHGNHSSDLNLDMAGISPRLDVSYVKGTVHKVDVWVKEVRSQYLDFRYLNIGVTGRYMIGDTIGSSETPDFVEEVTKTIDHQVTTTVTFNSPDVIDGYFTAILQGNAKNRESSPIVMVTEVFVFTVHEPGKSVSFPKAYRL